MDPEEDKKVKRIARFLEIGGTMLAEHCNVCGAPKFRYQGRVICPICDVQEERETPGPVSGVEVPEPGSYMEKDITSFETQKRVQASSQKPQSGLRASETADEEEIAAGPMEEVSRISNEREEVERTEKPARAQKVSGIHGDRKVLEDLIFKKMVKIADFLQDETDPRNIAEDLELIEKGLGLIEHLKRL